MSRLIKEKMVERYQSRFRDVTDVAVVSTQGVDVLKMTALRSTLRAKGIRAMVVHNRIGRRALAEVGLEGLKDLLRGPSTLVWGGESIVDIAKALAAEAKTLVALKIRGGVSDGQILTDKDIEVLSQLPGRLELIGRAVAMAIGTGARVAAQVKAPGGRIVSQVREYEKKASAAEAAAAEAAPPDAAAAAPAPEAAAAPAAPASEAAPAAEAPKAGQPPAAPKA
ncbi:MAG: 50S ribosomal protein L10 [Planctomycetes bacterium]|nr:50S ribosomal protein L10 [Planctomycetota bacterium]